MTALKVLLFVQHGDGPIKSHRIPTGIDGALKSSTLTREAPCRWWLVECENAAAGRALIADHEHYATRLDTESLQALRDGLPLGRILDSGVNAAAAEIGGTK